MPRPYLVTMGGTDIHVDCEQWDSGDVPPSVQHVLDQAQVIALFSEEAKAIVARLSDRWADKSVVVPQGIVLPPAEKVQPVISYADALKKGYRILLPSGLRRVKDVLHLLDAWQQLYSHLRGLKVTIIGERLEADVADKVQDACRTFPFLQYHEPVPFKEMGKIYAQADLVVNSSLQEGQSAALCEALGLGIPVIARNNAGNRGVITHGETGLLYDQPEEFVRLVLQLLSDPVKTQQMVDKAKAEFHERFNPDLEIERYLSLLQTIYS
ncbi:glycosyl transferase group 1 [Caldalkalibacillus thermarum TA2.A1]|uniref:Glycosyl transferase group 1 n=1 Tax=Caldalkalibacillus thermarum (strain TA2.A1) TaxID=986075 RepID=F5L8C4_CALTT|nr:glycosyltransferase family 4 protein [Caldalkalibacillus thermarum]EGL82444.1 glycosyl transferase group 1 [Caldalkalibacillus thermarum TA2.A1]QZT34988.1 glycosyltransferase family 4 protein [Caldalkalibacillus thermarum TA2.A1]